MDISGQNAHARLDVLTRMTRNDTQNVIPAVPDLRNRSNVTASFERKSRIDQYVTFYTFSSLPSQAGTEIQHFVHFWCQNGHFWSIWRIVGVGELGSEREYGITVNNGVCHQVESRVNGWELAFLSEVVRGVKNVKKWSIKWSIKWSS